MNRQETARTLRSMFGSEFVGVNQVAEYLGVHRNTASQLLRGLPYINGRPKRFAVTDVAGRIDENLEV